MKFFDVEFKGIFSLKKKTNFNNIYNSGDEGTLIYSEDDKAILYANSNKYNKLGGYEYIGNSDVKTYNPVLKNFSMFSYLSTSEYLYFIPSKDWNLNEVIIIEIFYQCSDPIEVDLTLNFYDLNNKHIPYASIASCILKTTNIIKLENSIFTILLSDFPQMIEIIKNTPNSKDFIIYYINLYQSSGYVNRSLPFSNINISDNYILTKNETGKHFTTFNCNKDIIITLPVPEPGLFFSFSKDSNYKILIQTSVYNNASNFEVLTYINEVYTQIETLKDNAVISLVAIDFNTYIIQSWSFFEDWNLLKPFQQKYFTNSSYSSDFISIINNIIFNNNLLTLNITKINYNFVDSPLCFGGVLSSDGTIYCVSKTSNSLLQIKDNTVINIPIDLVLLDLFPNICYTSNGELIISPNIIVNVESNKNYLSDNLPYSLDFTCGIFISNGYTYFIPYSSTVIYKYKSLSDIISLQSSLNLINGWYGACLSSDECIYCIPYNSSNVAKIDPENLDFISYYDTLDTSLAKWKGGVLSPNGNIYGIPYDSTSVLKITPDNPPSIELLSSNLLGSAKWSGGVLGPDGNIYGIPYDSTSILKIIPGYDIIELIPLPDGIDKIGDAKWSGGVLSPDGCIYGIPYKSKFVLKIEFTNLTENYNIQYLLSSYLNKF
jgi:hypothetical protein